MLIPHGPIRGFSGEDRLLRDDLLPDNVSPDAENTDYQRGTLKRRSGYQRLHTNAILDGGIRINTTTTNKDAIIIPDYTGVDLSGDFLLEVQIMLNAAPTNDIVLMTKKPVGSSGWHLKYMYTTMTFRFEMYDSGATLRTADYAFTVPPIGTPTRISVRRSGTTLTLYCNGSAGTPVTCSGVTANNYSVFIGVTVAGGTGSQIADYTVDELKIWSTAATQDAYPENELAATGYTLPDVGYWKFNEGRWNHVDDSSGNAKHGNFWANNMSYVASLLPNATEDDMALRLGADGDIPGADAQATTSDADALDIITTTGNKWTVEFWMRVDTYTNVSSDIISVGQSGNDRLLYLYLSGLNLYRAYGTTTTHTVASTAADTTYDAVVGTAFHVAIVRDADTVYTYINGSVVLTTTGATTENGPTPTTNSILLGDATNTSGLTIDELRVWKSARSPQQILQWMNEVYTDVKDTNLLAYYRFSAGDPERDETGNTTITVYTDGTAYLQRSQGLVYPSDAPRMTGLVTYSQPVRGDLIRAGQTIFKSSIIAMTRSMYWRVAGNQAQALSHISPSSDESLFGYAAFKGFHVFGNGIAGCMKYDGNGVPSNLTIDTPSTAPVDAPVSTTGGTFPATGDYYYRVSFRNSLDGTESLASDASGGATLAQTDDNIALSSIPVSTDTQVNQRRIYRKDPSGTVYYYLDDIDDNTTTTYTDTGTATTTTQPIDDYRGHLPACRHFGVFGNRLIACNSGDEPSGIYFSEADTINFPADNLLIAGDGDGDEITGCAAFAGYFVIFKERSIYVLTGTGDTTFALQRLSLPGCVSGATVAESKDGLYYLSNDGVYLFANGQSQYLSANQQDLFGAIDTTNSRYAAGGYNPKTHQYIVSLDVLGDENARISMVYDEDTKSWAKWTVAFDCYALAQLDDNEYALLGAKGGFVYRLFSGNTDGMPVYQASETTYSGTVTGNATAFIVDGSATFPTTDHGLAGCKVLVASSAGDQERTIIGNTATTLYLDSALSPSITGTYYVGAIDWYWESRWIDFGDMFDIKAMFYTSLWLTEGSATDITIKWKTDAYETWVSTTFSNADELAQVVTSGRGRKVKFRFQYQPPNKAIEIQSFQPVIARGKSR